jgi:hypothetical protein
MIDYQPRGIMVRLTDEEFSKAWEVGAMREHQNAGVPDASHYREIDRTRADDSLTSNCVAAVAEYAVAKLTGQVWHGLAWRRNNHHLHRNDPDVGERIEVRRVLKPSNGLPIRERDIERGRLMVLAYPLPLAGYRVIDVIGWIDATEGGKVAEVTPWGNRVPQRFLNSMELLRGGF